MGSLMWANLLQIIWSQRLKILYKYGPYDMGPKININLNKNEIQLCALSIEFLCALSLCLYTFCVRSLTQEREHAKSVKTQRERTYFLKNLLRGQYIMLGF